MLGTGGFAKYRAIRQEIARLPQRKINLIRVGSRPEGNDQRDCVLVGQQRRFE